MSFLTCRQEFRWHFLIFFRKVIFKFADLKSGFRLIFNSFLLRILKRLVEHIGFEATGSECIDAKSGVSARLSISAYENLISTAERRRIINNEKETHLRLSDLYGVIPSITGKIELVYEGEQEGPAKVAQILIGKAFRSGFTQYFPTPDS